MREETKERARWWLVCIVPRRVALWLVFGWLQRLPLPASWYPYLFGRMMGCDGRALQGPRKEHP